MLFLILIFTALFLTYGQKYHPRNCNATICCMHIAVSPKSNSRNNRFPFSKQEINSSFFDVPVVLHRLFRHLIVIINKIPASIWCMHLILAGIFPRATNSCAFCPFRKRQCPQFWQSSCRLRRGLLFRCLCARLCPHTKLLHPVLQVLASNTQCLRRLRDIAIVFAQRIVQKPVSRIL